MNSVILTGRIVKKPELGYTANQNAVTRFSLAVDRPKKDDGADFPSITVFGKQAENVCRYKDKGDMLAVHGRIQTGSYTDKNGNKVYTTDVIAERIEFIGGKSERPAEKPVERTPKVNNFLDEIDGYEAVQEYMPF